MTVLNTYDKTKIKLMETSDHCKNGATPKSQTSRTNKTKKMKLKTTIWLGLSIIVLTATTAFINKSSNSNSSLTLEVQQREGLYIILPRQKPTFEYEYVKTIDAGNMINNWRASTLIEKILKVYKKEGIKGDAIIFTEDDLWKADVIKFKGEKPSKVTVEPERREGVYIIYPQQKSTIETEYVKTIDAGSFIKNWRASSLIEKLLKVYKNEGVNADAMIFTEDDLWKADCVKIKK